MLPGYTEDIVDVRNVKLVAGWSVGAEKNHVLITDAELLGHGMAIICARAYVCDIVELLDHEDALELFQAQKVTTQNASELLYFR